MLVCVKLFYQLIGWGLRAVRNRKLYGRLLIIGVVTLTHNAVENVAEIDAFSRKQIE